MKYIIVLISVTCLFFSVEGKSQPADTLRATTAWNAQWIGLNALFDMGDYYSVYCFHKTINLSAKPATFYVHVSADNHYKLFINGKLVSVGPVRGDQFNWFYETINIAPYLTAGKNSIAAQVWNEANYRPMWQNTIREGFILQGNTPTEEVLNTNNTWKCVQDKSVTVAYGYFVAVNGENVDMAKAPAKGWAEAGFDDSGWPAASALSTGQLKGALQQSSYMLVPSMLPQRELTYQPIKVIRQLTGAPLPKGSLDSLLPANIPANKKVTVLLDQTFETNAFPVIKFSGGKGATISLSYAEALFEPGSSYQKKGNRDSVNGKEFRGLTDNIISGGDVGQSFTPFNFRTYRYVQLTIQTKGAPLRIDSLYGLYTAYPFQQKAVLNIDDSDIIKIRDIGWRTARLNAYETYTDCPYYEQLQYFADTRVQAMVSYYESGDDLLARNALNQMDQARLPEGVTLSVYPTRGNQVIPTFSLLYIGMLHDYYMYRHDNDFLKDKLVGVRAILNFFSKYQGADGSVVRPPYWNFVDWSKPAATGNNWFFGIPPQGSDGCSAVIDMQLLWACRQAAEMETAFGSAESAAMFNTKASQLLQTIKTKYWSSDKKLFADTKEKNTFSQHANALAILTGVVSDSDQHAFAANLVANSSNLVQCNIYFKYYLNEALTKAGLGDDYLNQLGVWRNNMAAGLTTWAEDADVNTTRSDCHGWGASPNVEFFRTVLGIDSDAPGFSVIKIEPHLGKLTNASGSIPHPNGKVAVGYVLKNNKWKIGVYLPKGTTGNLVWKSKTYKLQAGENAFVL